MLGYFRRTEAWAPKAFLNGIFNVLRLYPKEVIDAVVHPAVGIPSQQTFPPQPNEVKDACEVELRYYLLRHPEKKPRQIERYPSVEEQKHVGEGLRKLADFLKSDLPKTEDEAASTTGPPVAA